MSSFQDWIDRYVDNMKTLKTTLDYRMSWLDKFNQEVQAKNDKLDTLMNGDPSASSSGDGSAAGTVSGNGNEEKAWNYFASLGFTPEAIAGLLGNLKQESGINPNSHQGGGGAGRGIAQWTLDERWAEMIKWAKPQGKSEWDIATQLEWLWKEMQGRKSLANYSKMTDVEAATSLFEEKFEAAGKPNMPNRIKYAKEFYSKWGKTPPSANADTANVGDMSKEGYYQIKGGHVTPPTSANRSLYNSSRAAAAHKAGPSALQKLPSDKFQSNLDGCTMLVSPIYYPGIMLIYNEMSKNGLLTGGKMLVNSAYRVLDPDHPGGALDPGAHGWGGAIDIGTHGMKDALRIADTAWGIGFRAVAVGGSLSAGRGFVHVDCSPPGSWGYGYGTYKGPGSIKA